MTRPSRKPPTRILIAVAEDAELASVRWLLTGPDRRILMEGGLPGDGATPLPGALDRVVLAVPGQDVVTRRLDLGAARPAQARAAALFQLAQDMAEPAEDLHAATGAPDAEGRRMAAAVSAATLARWRRRAVDLGLTPDVILPDSLLPPAPEDGGWTALNLFDRVAMRGRDAAFTAEPDLAAAITGGETVSVMEADGRIAEGVIATALEPPLNLLEGLAEGAAPAGWRPWRRAMALAAALAAAPLLMIAAEAVRFEIVAHTLEQRSRDTVRETWPEAAPGADPGAEARRRLGPVLNGGFSGLAAALFTAIEQVDGTELETLVLDDGGEVRAAIGHRDYSDLERLNAALAHHGLLLSADSTLEENGRMVSDVVAAPL